MRTTIEVKRPGAGEKPTFRTLRVGDTIAYLFVHEDGAASISVHPGPRSRVDVFDERVGVKEADFAVTRWPRQEASAPWPRQEASA